MTDAQLITLVQADDTEQLIHNLFYICSRLTAKLQQKIQASGTDLTLQQLSLLYQLYKVYPQGLTAGQAKERMAFPGTDMTRLGDRLTDKGMMSREENAQNRRQVHFKLTPQAYVLLQSIVAQRSYSASIFNSLTPAELQRANQLFHKLKISM